MKRLSVLLIFCVLSTLCTTQAEAQNYNRIQHEVYENVRGTDFMMDVLIPTHQSGIAVVQVMNGGWVSSGPDAKADSYLPLIEKGQTVFFVGTGSRPTYKAEDMVAQVQHAVAYIRKHAAKFGIRTDAIFLTGGSSGGIIGLMAMLTAHDSAKVQGGAFFYPGTDLMHWTPTGETFYSDPSAYARRSEAFRYKKGDDSVLVHQEFRKMSPIRYVTPNTPPILLIHGMVDTVIPIFQSQIFISKLKENNVHCRLIECPGKGHGWKGKEKDYAVMATWFEDICGKNLDRIAKIHTFATNQSKK